VDGRGHSGEGQRTRSSRTVCGSVSRKSGHCETAAARTPGTHRAPGGLFAEVPHPGVGLPRRV
jgi:hypothetical protein